MNKTALVDRLKAQRDQFSTLIAELEAADAYLLANTPISELSSEQFGRICAALMTESMRPLVVATAAAANKVVANEQFNDEVERLSTGVRRSLAVVNVTDEDQGN